MTDVTEVSPMRTALTVALIAVATLAEAQTLYTAKPKPPVCTVECPPGAPGAPGRDGRDGKDGRNGKDAETGPRTLRAFDLWIRGVTFTARAVVKDGAKTYVLVYAAQFPAAALVDTATGLAQIAYPFDAGVGPDPAHPGEVIRFDDVTVLAPRSFLWWHRGASWSATWDESLTWQPLPGFVWR